MMMMSSVSATKLHNYPPQLVYSKGLRIGNMREDDDDDSDDYTSPTAKPLPAIGLNGNLGQPQSAVPVMRVPIAPGFLPSTQTQTPLKQDAFTPTQTPTVSTQQVNHIPPEMLAKLLAESASQEQQPVEARPSFTLTTSLPDERFIKNPASKAVTTMAFSTGIGATVCALLGAMVVRLRPQPTAIAYGVFGGLGFLGGSVLGLLLGATVLGRVAEQQQEMENKIHLSKTRVLVEQLTPISLDPIRIKVKRKKKPVVNRPLA
jgi:hypothetical protein